MMQPPAFEFHRIPVGIDNCFLLRGGTTILIDAGAPGHAKEFMHGMDRLGISLREIDLIRVRGMAAPVAIYEAIDHYTADTFPNCDVVLDAFAQGLAHYRRRSWEEASACFHEALAANPFDGPSRVYFERCARYQEDPPPANWDGVWNMPVE